MMIGVCTVIDWVEIGKGDALKRFKVSGNIKLSARTYDTHVWITRDGGGLLWDLIISANDVTQKSFEVYDGHGSAAKTSFSLCIDCDAAAMASSTISASRVN